MYRRASQYIQPRVRPAALNSQGQTPIQNFEDAALSGHYSFGGLSSPFLVLFDIRCAHADFAMFYFEAGRRVQLFWHIMYDSFHMLRLESSSRVI